MTRRAITGWRQHRTAAMAMICAAMAATTAGSALAQDLPNLREARRALFAESGAISWEVIPHESLSADDIATLDQINRIQPQPYYAAMAIAPDAGLTSERTTLAANYHDEENARAAALAACGAGCVVVMVIRPDGWQPGRALQLSAEATAALVSEYRGMGRRSRAMAISPQTGQWGIGPDRAAAVAACGAEDCRAVVEG